MSNIHMLLYLLLFHYIIADKMLHDCQVVTYKVYRKELEHLPVYASTSHIHITYLLYIE